MAISVNTLFEALGWPLDQPMIDHLVDVRRKKMIAAKREHDARSQTVDIPPCPTCNLEVSLGEWLGGMHLFCGQIIP